MRIPLLLLLATLLPACVSDAPQQAGLQAEPKASPNLPVDQARALRDAPPPESDLPPTREGKWSLACGAGLELQPGGALTLYTRAGTRKVGGEVVGEPAVADNAQRFVFAHAPVARPETVVATMSCLDGAWGEPVTLAEGEGAPDRVGISHDGTWVVWFSGASGLPSLWAAPFEGGDARQMTNVGIEASGASPGQPPAGFVPPPQRGAPSVEALEGGGYLVSWDSPDGPQRAELR